MTDSVKTKEKSNYNGFYNRFLKRCIDLVLALVLCVILLPVYLIIGIAVAIEDGLPVFYRPQRGGYRGKTFRIMKFRTMVKNADQIGGGTTALNDPRITKVGNLLRKTKLDETPQLFPEKATVACRSEQDRCEGREASEQHSAHLCREEC